MTDFPRFREKTLFAGGSSADREKRGRRGQLNLRELGLFPCRVSYRILLILHQKIAINQLYNTLWIPNGTKVDQRTIHTRLRERQAPKFPRPAWRSAKIPEGESGSAADLRKVIDPRLRRGRSSATSPQQKAVAIANLGKKERSKRLRKPLCEGTVNDFFVLRFHVGNAVLGLPRFKLNELCSVRLSVQTEAKLQTYPVSP